MNDLDPLLHDAMARVRGPVDARPSVTDVRRRARRHNRRRMTATVGVVACTGIAGAALIIRRDSADTSTVASAPTDGLDIAPSTTFAPSPTTSIAPAEVKIDATLVWNALDNLRTDPTAIGFVAPVFDADRSQMPTAETFQCTTVGCVCMLNYVVWHEVADMLGFPDMQSMQTYNQAIDFSQLPVEGEVVLMPSPDLAPLPTSTTIDPVPTTVDPNNETVTTLSLFEGIVLIDGGAPPGAMEDAYQRLPGYDRTIVPSSGRTVEQTMVMPIDGNDALATAVGGVFGIDGLDTWDPSLIGTNIQGMVAVVIGPDYFDLVGGVPLTVGTDPTTTSIVG
jgi:hypothetical protein